MSADIAYNDGRQTMRMGEQVLSFDPRCRTMRSIMRHHQLHHRGQLTVYLRLLNVPEPPTFGGTADVPMGS